MGTSANKNSLNFIHETVYHRISDNLSTNFKQEVENVGGATEWMEDVGTMFYNGNPPYNHPPLTGVSQDLDDALNEGDVSRAKDLKRLIDLDEEMRDIISRTRGSPFTEEIMRNADRYFQIDDEISEIYDKYY